MKTGLSLWFMLRINKVHNIKQEYQSNTLITLTEWDGEMPSCRKDVR